MRGLDGKIWLGVAKPRNPTIDNFAAKPFLRELTLRLPRAMWPIPKAYGHVIAFTEDGKVVADLQDASGAYPETTAVTETAERLYVQSLHAKGLGWLPRGAGAGYKRQACAGASGPDCGCSAASSCGAPSSAPSPTLRSALCLSFSSFFFFFASSFWRFSYP